ncbi:MAG: molybdopterin-dependent oxidoreductase [Burkholderiales bacterium]
MKTMFQMNRQRRGWLLMSVAGGLAAAGLQARAQDTAAAAPKVILTISGNVQKRAGTEAIDFDLAMLVKLPQTSFHTKTPWYTKPRKFTGVLLKDLLASVGGAGSTLKAMALNDYRAEIPAEDWLQHGAMLAYLLDDKPMTVREKGPLVIIYPFDDRREVRTAVHYSRAVWQLRSLELR